MSILDTSGMLAGFAGRARLFPLPGVVLFPHVALPLHIFEPRYIELVEDALAADRLVAMATLQPGWEPKYEGRPPLGPMVCLGAIVSHARLEDGRHNLLLAGLTRARLHEELPPTRLFREARVELVDDVYPPSGAAMRPDLREQLCEQVVRLLPRQGPVREQFEQILDRQPPLGMIVDLVSYTLRLDEELKQSLLAEPDVDRRTIRLLSWLEAFSATQPQPGRRFPPEFSEN